MKRILTFFVALFITSSAFSQALVQFVNNSIDPLLDSITVRVTSPSGLFDTTITNIKFRDVTAFIPVGAEADTLTLTSASTGAPLGPPLILPQPLMAATRYVFYLAGVASAGFDPNPDAINTSATLKITGGVPLVGLGNSTATFSLFQGVTDLQTVDIKVTGPGYVRWIADNLSYGEFYDSLITVPATQYIIDFYDSSRTTKLKSFYANLASAASIPGGAIATVFVSGAVNTAQGPEYNLFAGIAGFPTGPATPFRIIKTSELQVIHNAADPAAETVDIYVIGSIDSSEIGFLDNASFRQATDVSTVPSNTPLRIVVAPSTSTGLINALANNLYTVPVTELATDKSYVWIASGVDNAANFEVNPDGEAIDLNVYRRDTLSKTTAAGTVDLLVFNGATDLAGVDVDIQGGANVATDLKYGKYASVANTPAAATVLTVNNGSSTTSYNLDLSALGGQRVVLFFSGFADTTQNVDAPLELWAAEEDGDTYKVSALGVGIADNAFATAINLFPNPATTSVRMSFTLANTSEVQYRLVNMVGQTVNAADLGSLNAGVNTLDVNVSNLSAGVYMLNLVSNGATVNVPVIVNK